MNHNNRNIIKVSYSQSTFVACVWYVIAFYFHHPAVRVYVGKNDLDEKSDEYTV